MTSPIRLAFALAAAAATISTTACIQAIKWNIPPAGAAPGLVGTNVGYPLAPDREKAIEIPYDPSTIQILDYAETESHSEGIAVRIPFVGEQDILGREDSGYQRQFDKLMTEKDANGILNSTVEWRRFRINFILFRYTKERTRIGAVPFRFLGPPPGASPLQAERAPG